MKYMGHKIELPPKKDIKAWKALAEGVVAQRLRLQEKVVRQQIQSKHALEKKIRNLESKPEHPERLREINRMKKQLDKLTGKSQP